jgi:hypothetical protein
MLTAMQRDDQLVSHWKALLFAAGNGLEIWSVITKRPFYFCRRNLI